MLNFKQIINKPILIYCLILLAVLGLLVISNNSDKDGLSPDTSPSKKMEQVNQDLKYSLTDPSSPWVIVNKQYGIPTSFVPKTTIPDVKLRLSSDNEQMKVSTLASSALEELFSRAAKDNIQLRFGSGYRSAITQKSLYTGYIKEQGQAQADKSSARPGHSEHQTGLAVDIVSLDNYCFLEACWADTKEGKWLASNAHKFGFIIRYPKGKQAITGYEYEPWHLRYIGQDLAQKVYESNKTLEEYFGLSAAPNYL